MMLAFVLRWYFDALLLLYAIRDATERHVESAVKENIKHKICSIYMITIATGTHNHRVS